MKKVKTQIVKENIYSDERIQSITYKELPQINKKKLKYWKRFLEKNLKIKIFMTNKYDK